MYKIVLEQTLRVIGKAMAFSSTKIPRPQATNQPHTGRSFKARPTLLHVPSRLSVARVRTTAMRPRATRRELLEFRDERYVRRSHPPRVARPPYPRQSSILAQGALLHARQKVPHPLREMSVAFSCTRPQGLTLHERYEIAKREASLRVLVQKAHQNNGHLIKADADTRTWGKGKQAQKGVRFLIKLTEGANMGGVIDMRTRRTSMNGRRHSER